MDLKKDSPKEECGVLGIFAPGEDVARMAFFGLFALQHRGQEAAGLAVSDGQVIRLQKDVGLVSQVFDPQTISKMEGNYAIGHTRYSTTGSPSARNAQPFMIDTQYGTISLAHNGNLLNAAELRTQLMQQGVGMSSTSDTEVMIMTLACSKGETWFDRIRDAIQHWVGAYSLVLLTRDQVFAVRDPWGFRPLSVGMLPNGGGHVAASEFGALHTLGCIACREVLPGEIVSLSDKALTVYQALKPQSETALCTFEHIYFSRPDNTWGGRNIHQVRQQLGSNLAKEWPVDADVVIPIPDSSIPAAIGYANESGIPYNDGFIKNRYIGRTFIEPTDSLRKQGVALKYNVIMENVLNKRVVMVDDSIVRGNTTGPLIQLLKQAGAKEVHVRITCPPIMHPCYMGVDMGTREELIAANNTIPEICKLVGADSLAYLSLEKMMAAIGTDKGYCNACFTGKYPLSVPVGINKNGFEMPIDTQQGAAKL
ncbi:MAG: amidophosphoribosyltransferase [Chloroflexi bacterium HGW-Chloroflexi-5]|jgi:amidophosphoribosyltransferase|nr:MAG: amidophosphoribosyltransferase [Chloroflexi bacterium HGW-Chloroflexi-5]